MIHKKCTKNGKAFKYCILLQKELEAKILFVEISEGNILSIPDNDFIKYCSFCGKNIHL